MLVGTLWDPWETASYKNNMLPFSIIIKLHLYEEEASAVHRTQSKPEGGRHERLSPDGTAPKLALC